MKRTLLLSCALLLFASCAQRPPQAPPTPPKKDGEQDKIAEDPEEKDGSIIYELPAGSQSNPLCLPGKNKEGYKNPYPKGSHAHFAAKPKYPKTLETWCNDELLYRLTRDNSKIIICIPQQRARLYVNGQCAFDWPVSTGTNGHETPTGVFRVIEKKEKHSSSRYGKFVRNGKVINSNADFSKGVPSGAKFQAAGMPNWHRFTWDGVGMHGGRVVAGQRLSHGCIRVPYDVARKLFSNTQTQMPVYITRAIEDYAAGGAVNPIDVKYRPKPGNDYTDNYTPNQGELL